jgi:hypothetical protein
MIIMQHRIMKWVSTFFCSLCNSLVANTRFGGSGRLYACSCIISRGHIFFLFFVLWIYRSLHLCSHAYRKFPSKRQSDFCVTRKTGYEDFSMCMSVCVIVCDTSFQATNRVVAPCDSSCARSGCYSLESPSSSFFVVVVVLVHHIFLFF